LRDRELYKANITKNKMKILELFSETETISKTARAREYY